MVNSTVLSQITVYPVKSIGGLSLSSSWVEKQGLALDRRFMLALTGDAVFMQMAHPVQAMSFQISQAFLMQILMVTACRIS